MKELEDKDPNDMVNITIQSDDPDAEEWLYSKIETLKEYDPGFYYSFVKTRFGFLCKISTKVRNTEHDDFKRFFFQARIKFAENLKIR